MKVRTIHDETHGGTTSEVANTINGDINSNTDNQNALHYHRVEAPFPDWIAAVLVLLLSHRPGSI